MVMRDPPKIDI